MFQDDEYIRWANERTVHLLSYALDPNASKPEPLATTTRDGAEVEVLLRYPMFTASEAERLAADVDVHVTFPMHTPWVGVLALDGKTVLAQGTKGTPKEYRALYDAEQKKLGSPVPRPVWEAVRAALARSADADFEERWPEAVKAALAARDAVEAPPATLAERITARLASLEQARARALAAAAALRDDKARAAAQEKARADFAGLPEPSANAAPTAPTR